MIPVILRKTSTLLREVIFQRGFLPCAHCHLGKYRFSASGDFHRDSLYIEIETFFSFSEDERAAIKLRRGDHLRLAFGIHLGFLKMTGTTLNALDRIPAFVLARVAVELDLPTINIATVRSLYRRRQRTLYIHQNWAMELLEIKPFNERRQRALVRKFGASAAHAISSKAIAVNIMRWLYSRSIRIPGPRRIQAMALKVARQAEYRLAESVRNEIPEHVRAVWDQELFAEYVNGQSRLEWLDSPPHRRSTRALDIAVEKMFYLRQLQVSHYSLNSINLESLLSLAQRCRARQPAKLKSLKEPTRTLEIACLLRHCLLSTTDTILTLSDLRTTDLRRHAREQADKIERSEFQSLRSLVSQVQHYAADSNQSDAAVRAFVIDTLPDNFQSIMPRAQRYREALTLDNLRVRRLLRTMMVPRLEWVEGARIDHLLTLWKLRPSGKNHPLTDEEIQAVPVRWRTHVSQPDTRKAVAAFDAAVLTELRSGLRNGSVWAPESLSFVQHAALLISEKDWKLQRSAHYRELNLPLQTNTFLRQRIDQLTCGLSSLAEAVEGDSLTIDERGIHMQTLQAMDEDRLLDRARNRILKEIGTVQLPQIIVDIDKEVRFSGLLLQRPPRHTQELLAVYGAVLAHGTARSVSEVSLMMPGVSSTAISDVLLLIERGNVLRTASDAVVELMFRQSITQHWGTGKAVSSDGMSLDASRQLWNARVDPKRRTFGVGQYQHVLDRWGIIYNQPLVLGTRQAGAAIEGAVRQQIVSTIDRIAVDTHGYTDFAMGLARLLGFDLCPRLKSLNDRLLYVPVGMAYPESIASIVRSNLDLSMMETHCDQLVRVAASIKAGKVTATAVLKRFGSLATGDPLYRAGKALGRLERSIFLCDVMTNAEFRRELHRNLSHGEAVHSLQRKIYRGGIQLKRGRRSEELAAISGSLTLLTNIVMAWNTMQLQQQFSRVLKKESKHNFEHVIKVAPIHHRHINFNGHFTFPVEQEEGRLYKPGFSVEL